jgi:hypothetical protein
MVYGSFTQTKISEMDGSKRLLNGSSRVLYPGLEQLNSLELGNIHCAGDEFKEKPCKMNFPPVTSIIKWHGGGVKDDFEVDKLTAPIGYTLRTLLSKLMIVHDSLCYEAALKPIKELLNDKKVLDNEHRKMLELIGLSEISCSGGARLPLGKFPRMSESVSTGKWADLSKQINQCVELAELESFRLKLVFALDSQGTCSDLMAREKDRNDDLLLLRKQVKILTPALLLLSVMSLLFAVISLT